MSALDSSQEPSFKVRHHLVTQIGVTLGSALLPFILSSFVEVAEIQFLLVAGCIYRFFYLTQNLDSALEELTYIQAKFVSFISMSFLLIWAAAAMKYHAGTQLTAAAVLSGAVALFVALWPVLWLSKKKGFKARSVPYSVSFFLLTGSAFIYLLGIYYEIF